MQYETGKHCVFYHRYHLVWVTKYRYDVLQGRLRLRVRDILRQVCGENGVKLISGVLSSDHVHMFVSIPPKLAVSDLMRKMKGRSSQKVQRDFPELGKRYWGRLFWGRGYFSTTTGNITDNVVLQYLANHIKKPTDASLGHYVTVANRGYRHNGVINTLGDAGESSSLHSTFNIIK